MENIGNGIEKNARQDSLSSPPCSVCKTANQALSSRTNMSFRQFFIFCLMPVGALALLPFFGSSLLVLRSTTSVSCFFVLPSLRPRFFSSLFFRSFMTNMLVGRLFSPGPSTTPESHMPAVVIGLYADFVLRVRFESGNCGEGRSMGEAGSVKERIAVGAGMTSIGGREGALTSRVSFGDTSMGVGSTSCFRRRIFSSRLFSLSSSVSESVSTWNGVPCRLLRLPVTLRGLCVPVELARRERVLIAGDEGVIFADMGDAGRSAKPAWRFNFWEVCRSSLGIDFSFSSSETGDAERGESRKDMETVRHIPGRMWQLLKECVDGELTSSKP